MEIISWPAEPDGRYVIRVLMEGIPVRAMIDTGLVDPIGQVAFELHPAIYDQLRQAGRLSHRRFRFRRDASGRKRALESGMVIVSLAMPDDREIAIGPEIRVHVARGAEQLPNRVGVVFFHRLPNCSVEWNCTVREWTIRFG